MKMNSSKKLSRKVFELLKKIPSGKVTTYKILASKLNTKAYRLIGAILSKNPSRIKIPCHRVVRSDATLGGYSGGVWKKKRLLEKEGIKFFKGKIKLKNHLYRF